MPASQDDYLLGINQSEFDRLQFQHGVWRHHTDAFFDRLGVSDGWNCLDVGAGPGFVSFELRDRVGDKGSVTALEPSEMFVRWLARQIEEKGWTNVSVINGTVEESVIPPQSYDLIFVRWVIAFVSDPQNFFERLLPSLKPNGIIAFQDYYYEGLSLFPRGGAFDGMADVVRRYYRTVGGDPYITAKIPAWFRQHQLQTVDFTPQTYAGGPGSPLMEWAHRFFSTHLQHMVEKNVIDQRHGDALLDDWLRHQKDPDTLFFSPIVVDVAGKRSAEIDPVPESMSRRKHEL